MRRLLPIPTLLAILLAAPGPAARAFYKMEGRIAAPGDQSREEADRAYFTDLPVVTHEGKEGKFYTDFLKGRVVLISFFYTTCPTAPSDMSRLAEIRNRMAGETGKEVLLLSVSVDPERDTLEAVRDHARRYHAGEGWIFLTGEKENLLRIGRKLGNVSEQPESHVRLYLLGNLRNGHWMKLNQYAPVEAVVDGLSLLAAETPAPGEEGKGAR